MRKYFEFGGIVAGAVLIAFGVAAIVMGVQGQNTVEQQLANEYIVGTPDMTPDGDQAPRQSRQASRRQSRSGPTQSVANETIDTGSKARLMAQYMHIHALEATHGFTYAQMGIYTAKPKRRSAQLDAGRRYREPGVRGDRSGDGPARAERRPAGLGHGDGAHDRPQHELHGRADRALRDRGRDRAPAERPRVRDPRDRRGATESGARPAALPPAGESKTPAVPVV